MELKCRFSSCQWSGLEEEIFHHLEMQHKKYLREPTGRLYYDFVLSDLEQETFALVISGGLYWFCQNSSTSAASDGIAFGLFHIGHSVCQEYTLKLGLKRDRFCQYWGPLKTQPEKQPQEEVYELVFDYKLLTEFNEKMPSRKLRLYFGEFDDSGDVPWPDPEEFMRNYGNIRDEFVRKLTCAVCLEFIRRDARFCENKHFVCLHCFDQMLNSKKLRCPTCRGWYLYDCVDDELEYKLRLISASESNNET